MFCKILSWIHRTQFSLTLCLREQMPDSFALNARFFRIKYAIFFARNKRLVVIKKRHNSNVKKTNIFVREVEKCVFVTQHRFQAIKLCFYVWEKYFGW